MMKNMAATIITPMRMYIMSVIRVFLLAGAFDGNQDSTGTGIPKGPIRQAEIGAQREVRLAIRVVFLY